jgi:lipoprotein signal peptidase
MRIERYALLNVAGVVVWLGLCALIIRAYKKKKAETCETRTEA